MNKISVITLIGFLIIGLASCGCITPEHDHTATPTPEEGHQETGYKEPYADFFAEGFSNGRAVSLKALQEAANECVVEGVCPKDVLQLCGIKKVSGYAIDEKNKDIILIGEVDDTSPPLYLEDFVIALRNEWLIYAPLEGNTYYYSPPGCSIDPDPDVLNSLQQISGQISSSDPEDVQKHLNQWRNVCSQPQQVRVMGIPTESRFAKVMVEADYYMKRLVDGSVTLDIPGFTSLMDMTLNIARRDIQEGKASTVPLSSLNRFWFSPGENSFLEDEGVVYITKSEVRLLTEEEFLTKGEGVVGIGKPNPLADVFAKNFSARYTEIAEIKPIYSELEALFRFVSLAKIMNYKNAASEAGISLDYLLNQYPVKNTPVKKTLPGLSNVKEFQHKEELSGGYSIAYLWLPSCGGVSIDTIIKDSYIARDVTGSLSKTKKVVIKAKPSPDSLYWDFPSRYSEYKKIYQNIDKYPGMRNKRILLFNQKDESTIQIKVIGQNVRKVEDIQISSTLKEFIEKWNKADEKTKYIYLTEKNYLGELLSFLKKIEDAAEGNEIILDGPQCRDYADILNVIFAGNIMMTTKHAVPEAVAKTLNWNEQVKFKTSDVVILYSANPKYLETEQEGRIMDWKIWIEEINENLVDGIKLKIVESSEEVFQAMNEIKGKSVVVIRVGETGTDGFTILPKGGGFNARDMENNVADNPERVTAVVSCWSIKYEYPDACSKTGAGINIGTTREVLDKEDVVGFLRLFTKELEKNNGNLLDAFQYAINERDNVQNYYFINFAQDYLKEKPGDLEGAIKYAKDKIKGISDKGSAGILPLIDSRGVRE
jgi:hypothetical protein